MHAHVQLLHCSVMLPAVTAACWILHAHTLHTCFAPCTHLRRPQDSQEQVGPQPLVQAAPAQQRGRDHHPRPDRGTVEGAGWCSSVVCVHHEAAPDRRVWRCTCRFAPEATTSAAWHLADLGFPSLCRHHRVGITCTTADVLLALTQPVRFKRLQGRIICCPATLGSLTHTALLQHCYYPPLQQLRHHSAFKVPLV